MDGLARIVGTATPSTAVQFRGTAYGKDGVESFLRDVLALANAAVDGPRYIVTGISFDAAGRKTVNAIDRNDFSGKPSYALLVQDYIEPALQISHKPVSVDGYQVGVFEIGDCQDAPYMMRIDFSETLRRGDAFARVRNKAVKLGRSQLQSLFEKKFRDSVSAAQIEVGFPGDIVHKDLRVATHDLRELPSAHASAKLSELIESKQKVQVTATNTFVSRLMHARIFGSDIPYEERSTTQLLNEMEEIERRYEDEDHHFLFDERATKLQLIVINHGEEAIRDASLKLVMPRHPEFRIAAELPKISRDGGFVERRPGEQDAYPDVIVRDKSVQVVASLGDLPEGAPVDVFERHLRVCAGNALRGRRIGIQYALSGQNLRAPAEGTLRLLF